MVPPPFTMPRAAESVDDQRLMRPRFAKHGREHRHQEHQHQYHEPHDYPYTGHCLHGRSPFEASSLDSNSVATDIAFQSVIGTYAKCFAGRRNRSGLLRPFLPRRHVRDTLFHSRNHHFPTLLQRLAILAPRAGAATHSGLRENDFARAPLAYRAIRPARRCPPTRNPNPARSFRAATEP